MQALLEIKDVRASYGRIRALDDVSLTVGVGEIVALVGPNGAGKSSTLNAVKVVKTSPPFFVNDFTVLAFRRLVAFVMKARPSTTMSGRSYVLAE